MPTFENTPLSPDSTSDFAQPQFINGKFRNPKSFINWLGFRFWPVLRWMFSKIFFSTDMKGIPNDPAKLDETLPVLKPDFGLESSLSMTWIGHATCFVNIELVHFVTDPIWSPRASPFKSVGPKRYRPPPCTIEELPIVHFAVISHNHRDHFDIPSIRNLAQRFPRLIWFVPKGLKRDIEPIVGINTVYEMTWGESKTVEFNNTKTTIWCVPAQHWSRGGFLSYIFGGRSLWCGWAVVGPNRRFYYTGDTGFCEDEFKKIGEKLGPFDLAAIQTGCYAPRDMMSSQHVDLTEATEIHKLVKAKKSIGIHWGTYDLGSHFYLEPREKLPEFCKNAGIDRERFTTINLGETWIVEDDAKKEAKM